MSRIVILSSVIAAAGIGIMAMPASALPASPANTGLILAKSPSAPVEQIGYRRGHGGGVRFWLGSGHGSRWGYSSRRRFGGGHGGGGFGGGYGSRH